MNAFQQNNNLLISKNKAPAAPILWLEAEDSVITTVSGVVSEWLDKSGNDYHATQSIVADRPTYNTTITPRKISFLSSDRLFTSLPNINNGFMILGTQNGTAVYGVIISSGLYTIGRRGGSYMPDTDGGTPAIYAQVILPSTATQDDINYWINYIRNKGSGNNYEATARFSNYWRTWNEITTFPLVDTSSAIGVVAAWQGCTNMSTFPLINTSNVTNFNTAWADCVSLIDFPLIDTSSGTNFAAAWSRCSGLTSFPAINTINALSFQSTWYGCSSLTSFPLINTNNVTSFQQAWGMCINLTNFPANFFDGCNALNFANAFSNTLLSQTSIDNILVSINSNNTSNGTFNQSGGSAPSATGEAAITAMRNRNWSITVTGGF